jgi:hypothetical protein
MVALDQVPLGHSHLILSVAALVALLTALCLGRAPERILAGLLLTAITLDLLRSVLDISRSDTAAFRPDLAARDALLLIGIGIVALRANRLYPLIMAGAALVAALAHLIRWLDLLQGRFSYLMLTTTPSYVIVTVLWIGLARHIRRERRRGPYPAWREISPMQAIAATDKIG